LISGNTAFSEADVEAAITAFTILTKLRPENNEYASQLIRAENLLEVLDLIEAATSAEKNGLLRESESLFQQAVSLDPEWQPAKLGLTAIRAKMRQVAFADAMTLGFAALKGENFSGARDAFNRAGDILTESTEPDDALLQVDAAERGLRIRQLRQEADTAALDEDWEETIAIYETLLSEDESLTFATAGLTEAKSRLALDRKIRSLIDNPISLQTDGKYLEAQRSLTQASSITKPGPEIRSQILALSRLIRTARQPITIALSSDNQTEVTVYKIEQLGKFKQTQMTLNPGEYTIVGRRRGYRDVSQTITLLPGDTPDPILIRCTERI